MFFEIPSRREQIVFHLKNLSKENIQKHEKNLKKLFTTHQESQVNDTVHYTIDINYFGNVCAGLQAMIDMADDPQVNITTDIEELIHGKSIFVEVITKLNKLNERFNG